jgi:hypothetical protein
MLTYMKRLIAVMIVAAFVVSVPVVTIAQDVEDDCWEKCFKVNWYPCPDYQNLNRKCPKSELDKDCYDECKAKKD